MGVISWIKEKLSGAKQQAPETAKLQQTTENLQKALTSVGTAAEAATASFEEIAKVVNVAAEETAQKMQEAAKAAERIARETAIVKELAEKERKRRIEARRNTNNWRRMHGLPMKRRTKRR